MIDVAAAVSALSEDRAKAILAELLTAATTPAFGAQSKREGDLKIFGALFDVGAMAPDASLYEISTALRITRAKASNMSFDRDMRRAADRSGLDDLVRAVIGRARFAKDGEYVALEIENPLVREHLKDHLRRLGHLSDASFNASIVRMTRDGAADLASGLIPEEGRDAVAKALTDAGFEGRSLSDKVRKGLGGATSKIGEKAADKAVDVGIGAAGAYLAPIAMGAAHALRIQLGL